jgi:hypothetical protein
MKSYCSTESSALLFLLCFIFSGIMPVAEPIFGSGPAGRAGRPLSSSERSAYEDRKALEAYEKRNAEITHLAEDIGQPNQGNAALLYYQAFLLLPELDHVIDAKLSKVRRGIEYPDRQVRTFLGRCLPAIEIYETASRMPQCIWGVLPDNQRNLASLRRKLVNLSFVLLVDARTLAADSKYHAALEQCLTVRRFVRHLSEDLELCRYSKSCDRMTLSTVRNILGEMPPDADVLAWFQGQLAMFQEATTFLERTLQRYLKAKMDMVQSYSIASLRGMLLKTATDEQVRQNIRDLTDEQIRDQAIETVQGPFGSVFAILHSDKSAEQKHAEMQELANHTVKTNIPKLQIMLTTIHNDELGKDILGLIVGIGPEMTEEQMLSKMQKIIDKRVAPDAIQLLMKFSNALGREIDLGFLADSEMTDEQRLAEMQKVLYELGEAFRIDRTFGLPWHLIDGLFESQVRHTAQINSIKVAVEVYLVMAKTEQLPKELPDYLPKEPYTGRDFLYEITDEGFALRCRDAEFLRRKNKWLEFKVKK